MHTALEIARYIINKCIDLGRPVSNLQLQKILYYVQGEYMKKKNGEPLFEDEISAWQYGPVVSDVYYEYNNYSSREIDMYQPQVYLNAEEKNIIDPIIRNKSDFTAWELVKATHSEDPWKNSYNRTSIISKNKLRSYFLGE
jgi:Uncharacterized phage-associated protein